MKKEKVEIDCRNNMDEFDQAMEDARFVSGLLSLMDAALSTNQGRSTLNDNVEWVLIDANKRMTRALNFLEKYS